MNAEIGRVLGDRYRLIAPIGLGASAKVFLADDVRLLRRVALKMLHDGLADDPEFLRRFRAEAQAAAALSHPNVMAVYDWGDDGGAYIVTEYLAGGSLRAILDSGHVLTPSQALTVGLEAARALDYAHRRGFVHRDIKPANLLFGDDGRLRIADFGLARALAEAAWTEPQGAVLGTARYAAPEQAQGERLSVKADVYALALVLIEAVTGHVPFRSDTTLGTLMARVDRPLEVPEALGPLASVIERAGVPDPELRIDARTLAAGLLRAAKELSRPEPLPLVGALTPTTAEAEVDRTVHAPLTSREPAPEPARDLTDDDLRLDPPDWVSGSVPIAPGDSPNGSVTVESPIPAAVDGPDETRVDVPIAGDPTPPDGEDTPKRRRRWPLVLAIVLVLAAAGGAMAAFLLPDSEPVPEALPPVTLPVPLIAGLDEDQAVRVLEASGWRIEIERIRRDDTTPGDVLESRPGVGTRLSKGESITVVVSAGQELVDVPTGLVGRPVAEVEQVLTDVGLVPETAGSRFDETVPAGSIVELSGEIPEQLERGSVIGLIVSDGPQPRTVPTGLTGQKKEAALDAIRAAQLEPEVQEASSDDVEKGHVIGQSPAGGTLRRGATVTITISTGPKLVKVPDVSDAETPKEAAALIREAGLEPGEVTGPAEGSPKSTDPAAGTEVRKGAKVDIVVG